MPRFIKIHETFYNVDYIVKVFEITETLTGIEFAENSGHKDGVTIPLPIKEVMKGLNK